MLNLIAKLLAAASVASAAIIITGATQGGTQNRLEIRDMYENHRDTWYLYMQALIHFQSESQDDLEGYYGVATAHGLPGGPWDGSHGVTNNPFNCPHVSPSFPMWHRAYVMLYEQRLQANALYIASKYKTSALRSKYTKIAQEIRSAYWDWALEQDGTGFPNMFTDDEITIWTYNGQETVRNPLKAYKFQPNSASLRLAPWSNAQYTNRCPKDKNNMYSPSNQAQARANIDNSVAWFRTRVFKLLTKYDQWYQISDSSWLPSNPNVNNQDSFEAIHDNVHGAIGGNNGNMAIIPASSFDPVFWLHHTNIDRLFAIWQAIHPDSFYKEQKQKSETFWYAKGSTAYGSQGLSPFKKDSQGNYWNSNDLRQWTDHHYSYEDTPRGHTSASVLAIVNKKYGSGSSGTISKRSVPAAKSLRSRFFGSKVEERDVADDAAIEYLVNIYADRNALDRAYTLFAFLGEPTTPSSNWISDPNTAGYQFYLPPPMANLTAEPLFVASQFILNTAINKKIASGEIHDNQDTCIQDYLQKNLVWKVVDNGGNVLDTSDVPHLQVSVAVTQYGKKTDSKSDEGFIASTVGQLLGSVSNTTLTVKSSLLKSVYQGKPGALTNSSMYEWGLGTINTHKS